MTCVNIEKICMKVNTLSVPIPLEVLIAWESSEEAWCLKDMNKIPIYTNSKYNLLLTPVREGKPSALGYFKPSIHLHDQRVIEEMQKIEAIGILPVEANRIINVFCCERMPYFDKHANLSGIISHIKPLNSISSRFFISGEVSGNLTITKPSDILSEKEWVVAFLILQGMTEKEMAEMLNRTLRTIKFHKGNILAATNFSTTKDFILFARNNKWQYYIPPLFAKPCYVIQ